MIPMFTVTTMTTSMARKVTPAVTTAAVSIAATVSYTHLQKLIYAGGKFLHREGVFPLDQVFDVVEIASDGALQLTDLFFLEIVFRDGDI